MKQEPNERDETVSHDWATDFSTIEKVEREKIQCYSQLGHIQFLTQINAKESNITQSLTTRMIH